MTRLTSVEISCWAPVFSIANRMEAGFPRGDPALIERVRYPFHDHRLGRDNRVGLQHARDDRPGDRDEGTSLVRNRIAWPALPYFHGGTRRRITVTAHAVLQLAA
jgi:hypothetical protein